MNGRLAAPPASRGCLDLAAIDAFSNKLQLIDQQAAEAAREKTAELRDFVRDALKPADQYLADRFWAGDDVIQLVHARAWVVEQLLLLAWNSLVR